MKNKIQINKWFDFNFKLDNNIVTNNQISLAFNKFKEDLLLKINSTITSEISETPIINSLPLETPIAPLKLLILFKIKTINNQFKSISYMQTIELQNMHQLEDIFIEYWNLKDEDYHVNEISDITFTYYLSDELQALKTKLVMANKKNSKENLDYRTTVISGNKLPNSMDFSTWGDLHYIDDNNYIVYKKASKLEFHIKLFEDYQIVKLKVNDSILLTFKDEINRFFPGNPGVKNNNDLSCFKRTTDKHEYIFDNGELLIKKIKKIVPFLTKVKRNLHNSKNFITMDLETRIINEEMTSYCVSIYDGKEVKSFYLSDYTGPLVVSAEKEMLKASILYLMKRKYHDYRVYLHNFSKFDSIFLLTVITELSNKVKPVLRDGRFIDLRFHFGNKYKIFFRDSLLLLPGSLKNLAKNFNVEEKGIFPYKFVNNKNISLDYVGFVPDISTFDNLSYEEYNNYKTKYKTNNWNLRKETIKYCELDCIVLYQILNKFSNNIFKLFRLDILKYPTLSSLAFAIYRSKFLNEEIKIPLIHGEIYNFIKKSYTGGSVDVYKPRPLDSHKNSSKVYRYDVNSLYPYAMKHFPMPCGQPIYFEGDILNPNLFNSSNIEDKPFGIFEVDIETPSDMKIPLLQLRIKTNNGFRTIAPLGNWTGNYFSDELYNASKYGYKFKVKRGYLFERGNLFTEYVDYLYELKKNSDKQSPNYIISKLLLNSLYGRLGMNPISEQHLIISNKKGKEFYSNHTITDLLDLKNGKLLISYYNDTSDTSFEENYDIKNVSIVVAATVTASARIHMSQFKTNNEIILYYTDTDSIDINKELDSKYVGSELGLMKLEHVFNDAVFLSPKMYGGITDDYEYVKIKGLKNPIKFKELKPLLQKNIKLVIKQEKWYSDISNGKFHIKDEIYTVMTTESKRKLLYNDRDIFYDTTPLTVKDGKIII